MTVEESQADTHFVVLCKCYWAYLECGIQSGVIFAQLALDLGVWHSYRICLLRQPPHAEALKSLKERAVISSTNQPLLEIFTLKGNRHE